MVEAAVLRPPVAAAVDERPLRVLVLASKAPGLAPGQRFRFEQWAPRLERDHRITLDLDPFESPELSRLLYKRGHVAAKAGLVARDFLRRAAAVTKARNYDAVLIVREAALIGPAIYERLIALTNVPMMFDFDDAIWKHQPGSSLAARLHFLGKIRSTLRRCAAVSAGNDYLADFARSYNANVFVVPTTIELDDYPVIAEPDGDGRFVVCWTGSTSTLRHFILARPALEAVAAKVPLTVKVICNEPPQVPIEGAKTVFVPWTEEGEACEVGACHAAIMPLPDDEFARGKCGLKALQAMATGRPVVISPVGMNCKLIRQGENGYLADTSEEYAARLLELAGSGELRKHIGDNARRTVEEGFSAAIGATRFASVLRSAVGRS
jgi:glycosyltransferase involved in cell wall biosynthesis